MPVGIETAEGFLGFTPEEYQEARWIRISNLITELGKKFTLQFAYVALYGKGKGVINNG